MESLFQSLLVFVKNYPEFSYIILFFGALFDTLIPVSFFVYGEIFFIAGSLLAGIGVLNIIFVSGSVLVGGFLGDNLSYLLGKYYGTKIIKQLQNYSFFTRFFSSDNQIRFQNILKEKGGFVLFFARVGGPLAWVTPFFAGTFLFPYRKFVVFNTAGIFTGISIFLFIGYFFGANFSLLARIFQVYFPLIIFGFFLCIIAYMILKKYFFTGSKYE